MKKNISQINTEHFYDTQRNNDNNSEKRYYNLFAETIKNIRKFAIGPYFWFIVDTSKMQCISDNHKQFTPYSKEQWLTADHEFIINLFHPDDRLFILGAFQFAHKVTSALLSDGKNCELHFNFYGRMINPEGDYRWILLQCPLLHTNEDNMVGASLIVITDIPHLPINSRPLLSMIDYKTKEIQYFKHFDQEPKKNQMQKPNITKREKEILVLMAQGLNSPQIAEKLTISYHTVENHKDNLRKKTNTKTAAELIAYTMSHSLLLL
ncbi:helix-turn-helix transcriptional regulator [Elizabethkingia meningoseptica]|uniref:helix-turn-helix transcriptional regulator n=1 Tax=Elizabethkingia meningoseptica TaxID=238 RepID=UPI0009376EBE|nr:LuxR C-terminal-related transcriptional regulator [Elizabethkingia meningoseptica]